MSIRIEDYRNMDKAENEDEQELLDMIHKIKKHETPPKREDDPYDLRYPWQKLGGVSSGICMAWCWYWDTVILEKATKEDLIAALSEYDNKTGV